MNFKNSEKKLFFILLRMHALARSLQQVTCVKMTLVTLPLALKTTSQNVSESCFLVFREPPSSIIYQLV